MRYMIQWKDYPNIEFLAAYTLDMDNEGYDWMATYDDVPLSICPICAHSAIFQFSKNVTTSKQYLKSKRPLTECLGESELQKQKRASSQIHKRGWAAYALH